MQGAKGAMPEIGTCMGAALEAPAGCPSCPLPFWPQAHSDIAVSLVAARVCNPKVEIAAAVGRLARTAVVWLANVPLPSSPSKLRPHAQILPPTPSATECRNPPASDTTGSVRP